ncbi:hypothetical protein PALB_25180 [Pseudoalteromonas luteoviolacea B = ATCC 29581]|nr:hypothetical protein PALB_25180 [Pseudoalteromonas luteoviolacea B = ATCC 29581]
MSISRPTKSRQNAFTLSEEIVKPFDLYQHLPYRVAVVSNLLLLDRDPLIRHLVDLDARSMRVLLNIGSYSPIIAADIAYQSRLDPYSVTRAISDLKKRQLVVDVMPLGSSRAKPVKLSEKGMKLYRELVHLIETRMAPLLNGIDESELESMMVTLAKLEHNAEAMLAEHAIQVEDQGGSLTREQQEFQRWQQRSNAEF